MATNKESLLNQIDEFDRTITPILSNSNKDLLNEFQKIKALANGVPEIPTWFAGVETTLREQQTQLTNNVNTKIGDLTNLINANQTNLATRLGPEWTNWTGLSLQFLIFLLWLGKVWWDEQQKRILRQDLASLQEHLRQELKK